MFDGILRSGLKTWPHAGKNFLEFHIKDFILIRAVAAESFLPPSGPKDYAYKELRRRLMFRESNKLLIPITAILLALIFYTCSKDNPTNPSVKIPILTTTVASAITQTTAQCGGTIISDSGLAVTARGVCWSNTIIMPTISNSRTLDGSGAGSFTSSIIGLSAATRYYVRAYATNSAGTGYGNVEILTTLPYPVPVVTTSSVMGITRTTAICGGTVTSDSGAPVIRRGVCWSTNPFPNIYDPNTTDSSGVGSFSSSITGLEGGISYNVRAYAINVSGVGYGNVVNFRTLQVPTLTTSAVTGVTETTAICGGFIYMDGGAIVTARGVCWSADSTPTVSDSKTIDGFGVGGFTSNLTALAPSTPYYIRAYATNSAGTGYGGIAPIRTADSTGTVIDIDGNIYATVKIGTQWWMAENLRVTHYRTGVEIPNVTDSSEWANLNSGGYCDYDTNEANAGVYGRLYNWYTIYSSGVVAPAGWHVPTDAEWQILADYLGDDSTSGGKLKEAGTAHWISPNTGATNETRFTALPAGVRFDFGSFLDIHEGTAFWSRTGYGDNGVWFRSLSFESAELFRNFRSPRDGISIRCVKD
jgi:uncharacterized protein (TIGR02145 family)